MSAHCNLRSLHKAQGTRHISLVELVDIAEESDGDDIENQQKAGKLTQKTKTINIDGKDIQFELVRNLTTKPERSRKDRKEIQFRHTNVDPKIKTSFGIKFQRYLMSFSGITLISIYVVVFIITNLIFAGLWFIQEEKCCQDPDMTFAQIFDFSIQTSTTIGYGSYSPHGFFSNWLVVALSVISFIMNTMFAGLLFFRFVTPQANIEVSDVMTMSNFMGTPCIEIRVGNMDGSDNSLIDVKATLHVLTMRKYEEEFEEELKSVGNTEEMALHHSTSINFDHVWNLRHFVNESSPLYGLRLDEFPGTAIHRFHLSVTATHTLTNGNVSKQAYYEVQDLMIGHRFEDQTSFDVPTRTFSFDYSKMNRTKPAYVWYPSKSNYKSRRDLATSIYRK